MHLREIGAARRVWPHHFIVAHVNDEKVGLKPHEFPNDLVDHVGIDRHDSCIDDLDFFSGITSAELRSKLGSETEAGHGNALSRRLAQDDDSDGIWRFMTGETEIQRPQIEVCRKEQIGKIRISAEVSRLVVGNQKSRRSTESCPAQSEFEREEKDDRNYHGQAQSIKPDARSGVLRSLKWQGILRFGGHGDCRRSNIFCAGSKPGWSCRVCLN